MTPLLTEAIFPADVLAPLRHYMARPAATTSAQPALMRALGQYNAQPPQEAGEGQLTLRQVAEGQIIQFQKKSYVRGKLRRSRIVCKDIRSGRSYAILAEALVTVIHKS